MASLPPDVRRRGVGADQWQAVDVYRRADGCLVVHGCPGDTRGLSAECVHVGYALLHDDRWTRRLGCPPAQARAAVVPREFACELIAEIQVLG